MLERRVSADDTRPGDAVDLHLAGRVPPDGALHLQLSAEGGRRQVAVAERAAGTHPRRLRLHLSAAALSRPAQPTSIRTSQ